MVSGVSPRVSVLVIALLGAAAVPALAEKPIPVPKAEPATIHTLRARDTGICEEVRVSVGDSVGPGRIVAVLDNYKQLYAYETTKRRMNSRSAIEIAESELAEKEKALEDAEVQHRRRKISDAELERAASAHRVAKIRLAIAKENAEQAKLDHELAARALQDRFVRSPVAGRVLNVHRTVGERVQPGEPVVTVGDFTELSAEVTLTRDAAAKLVAGSTIPVKLANSAREVTAVVKSIAPAAKAANGEKIVRLVFENPEPPQTTDPLVKNTPSPLVPQSPVPAPPEAPAGG